MHEHDEDRVRDETRILASFFTKTEATGDRTYPMTAVMEEGTQAKEKATFTQVDSLRPGTSGHNLRVKVSQCVSGGNTRFKRRRCKGVAFSPISSCCYCSARNT